jgi:hypothetical protein
MSLEVGDLITVKSDVDVFTDDMVGRQIWRRYDSKGNGGGRSEITDVVSATEVTCEVLTPFETGDIPAGSWFLTTDTVTGLNYLEGEEVVVVADGGKVVDSVAVSDGKIIIDRQASKIIVGYPYRGTLQWLNIDSGGQLGPAVDKMRIIISYALRVLNSLGLRFGASLYDTQKIEFFSGADKTSRPPPLYTGVKEDTYSDGWDDNTKQPVLIQTEPHPATILSLDLFMDTTDE